MFKIFKQLFSLRLRGLIKFYLARLGVFSHINSYLVLIEKTNLPKYLKGSLKQMAFSDLPGIEDFIKSYLFGDVQLVNKQDQAEVSEPVLVCAVKNDLDKIKIQMEHHRKIGVKRFIYIDNISTDGTLEWLKEQKDVTLYKVEAQYNSATRMGWWQYVIKQEGFGKWYLILDSDELFAYPNMENISIQRYIAFLEMKKITTTTTPMIDMYSQNEIFEASSDDIRTEFCFFDTFYHKEHQYVNWLIFGGPRYRLFSMDNQLAKHSLLKIKKNMLVDSHEVFPICKNTETGVIAFLLHYKFLPKDVCKYREIVETGNFFNGSEQYRIYMEFHKKNPDISFFYSGSQKLNSSMDLLRINIADRKFFKEYLNWA